MQVPALAMRTLQPAILILGALVLGCGSQQKDVDYVAYCPKCNDEVAYGKATAGTRCNFCGPNGPYRLKGIRGEDRTPAGWGGFIAWSVVAAVFVLGSAYAGVVYHHYRREASKKQSTADLRCRCPGCRRKFAYSSERVGFSAICPRCKKRFELPAPQPEAA